jgi:hypothetical protein
MARRRGADVPESNPIVSDVDTNHQAKNECQTRATKQSGSAQFAKAITRSEFARFYYDGKPAELAANPPRARDKVKRG